MRKRIVTASSKGDSAHTDEWLDLESLAQVEVSSEDPAYPVENALLAGRGSGWCAAAAGAQVLRIVFDAPQRLRRIRLRFVEASIQRTQEFSLSWRPVDGPAPREIVRQQWTFSPGGATEEVEEYVVELSGVTALELAIVPDIQGGEARASLHSLRLA